MSGDYNEMIYSSVKPDGFSARAVKKNRDAIFSKLSELIDFSTLQSVLDVGATSDRENLSSNFFEAKFPFPERVTALSNQNASWMESVYPGLKFVLGDALDLPFHDSSFDLVFSSAVIEHVGSRENQVRYISECVRTSSRYVFLTTPNRWHFIEAHTVLPFVHWLPKSMHRSLLKLLGKSDLAKESNLNLLDKNSLHQICNEIGLEKVHFFNVPFMLFPFNLLLFIEK